MNPVSRIFGYLSATMLIISSQALAEGKCKIALNSELTSIKTGEEVLATSILEREFDCPKADGNQLNRTFAFTPQLDEREIVAARSTGNGEMVQILSRNLQKLNRTIDVAINNKDGFFHDSRIAASSRKDGFSAWSTTKSELAQKDFAADADYETDRDNVYRVKYSFSVSAE